MCSHTRHVHLLQNTLIDFDLPACLIEFEAFQKWWALSYGEMGGGSRRHRKKEKQAVHVTE